MTCRRGDGEGKTPPNRAGCRKTVTRPDEVPSGDGPSPGSGMTMRRRGVRAGASAVLIRYRYELGNCNDLNLAAWCGRMLVAMARCDDMAFSASTRLFQ